jgi:hypothetical protein
VIKKLIFLNLALMALVAFLGYRVNADFKKFWTKNNVNNIKKEAAENAKKASSKKAAPANAVVAARPAPPPTEYQVIADKNLFSETRSMVNDPVLPPEPPIPELNPKPYLYGVIEDSSNVRTALIEDNGPAVGPPVGGVTHPIPGRPGPAPSIRKTMVSLKLGEYYRGYKVTEITSDRVTLTYGDNKKIEYIPLFDKNKPKAPPAHAMMPPPPMPANYNAGQVVSLSGGNSKTGTPGQGNAGVGMPPPVPVPTTGTSPSVTSLSSGSHSTTGTGATAQPSTSSPSRTTPTTPKKGSTSEREIIKDGKRYIRTPFGDVPRDN